MPRREQSYALLRGAGGVLRRPSDKALNLRHEQQAQGSQPYTRAASQESRVFDTKNCLVGCLAQQPEALLHQLPGSMLQRKRNPPPLHAELVQITRVSKQKVQVSDSQATVQHTKSGSARANYTTGAYRVSLEVGSALQKVQATATCSMSFNRNLSLFFSALK